VSSLIAVKEYTLVMYCFSFVLGLKAVLLLLEQFPRSQKEGHLWDDREQLEKLQEFFQKKDLNEFMKIIYQLQELKQS
jgi:hypothetical protein